MKKLQWLPTPGLHPVGQGSVFPRNTNAANADLDVDPGPPIVMAAVCSEGGSVSSIPAAHLIYRVISGSCKIVGAEILIILKENMHFKLLYLIYTSNILF